MVLPDTLALVTDALLVRRFFCSNRVVAACKDRVVARDSRMGHQADQTQGSGLDFVEAMSTPFHALRIASGTIGTKEQGPGGAGMDWSQSHGS